MSPDDLLDWLGIDPDLDLETRRRVQSWAPKSEVNVEELGHYLEVSWVEEKMLLLLMMLLLLLLSLLLLLMLMQGLCLAPSLRATFWFAAADNSNSSSSRLQAT